MRPRPRLAFLLLVPPLARGTPGCVVGIGVSGHSDGVGAGAGVVIGPDGDEEGPEEEHGEPADLDPGPEPPPEE
jgi:hypothetical protein